MLRSRGIPDLTRKQPVPYRIQCLDRTHTYRKSTPDEWIVIVRPGCRPFWGILFRMLDVLAGHQIRLLFDANLVTLALTLDVHSVPIEEADIVQTSVIPRKEPNEQRVETSQLA